MKGFLYIRNCCNPAIHQTLFSVGGLDLAIMVDASASVRGGANFQLVMNFVTDVFHSFKLGKVVRYGLVVFGSRAKVCMYFVCTVDIIFYQGIFNDRYPTAENNRRSMA